MMSVNATIKSQIITTIAGSTHIGYNGDGRPAINAQLNNHESIAIDSKGNILTVDFNNFTIRKIDAIFRNISTLFHQSGVDISSLGKQQIVPGSNWLVSIGY